MIVLDLAEIKALMDHMAASNLTDFVYQDGQTTLKLAKKSNLPAATSSVDVRPVAATTQSKKVLKAPLVGVFYTSAAPDKPPFVKVGDVVTVGQTVGVIEAMKMMHEVKAEQAGKVTQVLIGNEQRVGFDDPLFELD
ncbi:acetyl-CoA carboxylase biotin carboxyl carrier protein subunit [Loigolactobacillus coryniformis]|uniref:acetyl-CoA carboxylase biotin carboxyl carrier protein n=1 Tax=Loigolactobacillus coryniformis TaxID=1610 RepID=UPI002341AD8B|nr:biotin/lipoyl-containing protein [Loigolactobacillus coryniformis]MDC4185535.1 acetyl-CoA carboxylase biotin carboxyl carrier protein subunit [Loigolactobacillus coryniformis]